MNKIIKYKHVPIRSVQSYIEHGYQPYGSPFVERSLVTGAENSYQIMVKLEDIECACGYIKEFNIWGGNGHNDGLCPKNENEMDDGLLYEFVLDLVSKTSACQKTFGNTNDVDIDSMLSRLKDIIRFNENHKGKIE